MKSKHLYHQLSQSSIGTKLAATAVLVTMLYMSLFSSSFFFFSPERSNVTPEAYTPVITLEPASGGVETRITVRGKGWPVGSLVSIYLTAPDEVEILDYPVATTLADFEGRLATRFVFPSGNHWEGQEAAIIIARTDDGRLPVQAAFNLESGPSKH